MKKRKILIVEDEGVQAMNTKLTLLRMGYEVLPIAISAKSAVDLAREHIPDLILMDIRLRGKMDGIEAARIIKKDIPVPVIFITAYADETTMKRARGTGPAAFLEKPVDESVLGLKIKEAFTGT